MTTETDSNDHLAVIADFLEGDSGKFEGFDEPPLANRRVPLLDGERIHLERDENGDE